MVQILHGGYDVKFDILALRCVNTAGRVCGDWDSRWGGEQALDS